MTVNATDARRRFAAKELPSAILDDPSPFYEAFSEGEDALAVYLTSLWECGRSVADSPFFPELQPFILEDSDEGFCALLLVTLPATAAAKKTVSAVVFGSAMDPRVFAALPEELPKGDTLSLREYRLDENNRLCERALGALYQGCDNDLQLFDPPAPQPVDRDKPLPAARQEAATVDRIVRWCLEND
ncbi:MAG: hypothetical protein ACI39E_02375 [Acutalibacteraceae bacterium]